MDVVFDRPQWKLTEAPEMQFAWASSVLVATSWRGRTKTRHIDVPAAFFLLTDSILSPKEKGDVHLNGVEFFLMQIEDHSWIFGFGIRSTEQYWFLWRYTEREVPGWLIAGL